MEIFEEKLKSSGLSDAAINAFRANYEQLVAGVTGLTSENEISPVTTLPKLEEMENSSDTEIKGILSKTAVLKLNGGLGTSMGLEKAKSLLKVKNDQTFLDLIAQQILNLRKKYECEIKFILMNSFSTSGDTKEFLKEKYPEFLKEPFIELIQNKSPKVDAETLKPVQYPDNPEMEWCPPGHGDIYPSLLGSGMLKKLLDAGINYLFVSNSDNLGATIDLKLLNYFVTSDKSFLMEVCERTESDKKGGHLCIRKSDDRMMLRESAMCPESDKKYFEDINIHKFFNTNSLWINLNKLDLALRDSNGFLKLPLIKNKKTVNPRDSNSNKVFQLETAMGSAIECFNDAGAVIVPRSRFAPVKTCNDLFALRSDAYEITEEKTVVLAGNTTTTVPFIKLDDKYYKLVDDMEKLVHESPSLINCKSLYVTGPVLFGKNIELVGDVKIINNTSDRVYDLPSGRYQDTVVTSSASAIA